MYDPRTAIRKGWGLFSGASGLGVGNQPAGALSALFDFNPERNRGGTKTLPEEITIAGHTVLPHAVFRAEDATGSAWPSTDGTFVLDTVTGTPDLNQPCPTPDDVGVFFGPNERYNGSDTVYPTDGMFYVEMLCRVDATFNRVIFGMTGGSGGSIACDQSGTKLRMFFNDGTTNTVLSVSATYDDNSQHGEWYFLQALFRPANRSAIYGENGNLQYNVFGSTQNTGTSTRTLQIGSAAAGDNIGVVSYLAFYGIPDADISDAATLQYLKDRAHRVTGTFANASPSFIRTTKATMYKDLGGGDYRLFYLGNDWARNTDHPTLGNIYWAEPQSENLFLYSEDLTNAVWMKSLGSIDGNSVVAPDGFSYTTCDFVADSAGGSAQRSIIQSYASTTGVVVSAFVKKGDRDYVSIRPNTSSSNWQNFNLDTGSVASTSGSIAGAGIESIGNDWYRCWVYFNGTTSASGVYIQDTDNTSDLNSVAGDDSTVSVYVWGLQVEDADALTSYIPTQGSTVPRALDGLSFTVPGIAAKSGSAVVAYTSAEISSRRLLRIGGGNSDQLVVGHTTGDRANCFGQASSSNIFSLTRTGALSTLTRYTQALSFQQDHYEAFLNGVSHGVDVSGDLPTHTGSVYVGFNGASPNGGFHRVQIFGQPGVKDIHQ